MSKTYFQPFAFQKALLHTTNSSISKLKLIFQTANQLVLFLQKEHLKEILQQQQSTKYCFVKNTELEQKLKQAKCLKQLVYDALIQKNNFYNNVINNTSINTSNTDNNNTTVTTLGASNIAIAKNENSFQFTMEQIPFFINFLRLQFLLETTEQNQN